MIILHFAFKLQYIFILFWCENARNCYHLQSDLVIVHYSPRLFLPYDEKFEIFNVLKFLYSLILKKHSINIFKSKFKA